MIRKLVAELDEKINELLSALDGEDEDEDTALFAALEALQAEITPYQLAKGYI